MSIFDRFNKAPDPQIKEPEPAPTPDPEPTPPPEGTIPEAPDLSFFNKLIKPETEPEAVPDSPLSVTGDILTQENMQKIADAQDFAKQIPPEIMQKLQSGDQAAMMEAMQAMAKAAYVTAMSQTGSIVDTIVKQQEEVLRDKIKKEIMSSIDVKESTSGIPGIENPIVRSGAEMISSQLRQQFPQATAEQIRTMTQRYFSELSSAMNPQPDPPKPSQPAEEVDWMEFAGFTTPKT